jgi:hypothetical protein
MHISPLGKVKSSEKKNQTRVTNFIQKAKGNFYSCKGEFGIANFAGTQVYARESTSAQR